MAVSNLERDHLDLQTEEVGDGIEDKETKEGGTGGMEINGDETIMVAVDGIMEMAQEAGITQTGEVDGTMATEETTEEETGMGEVGTMAEAVNEGDLNVITAGYSATSRVNVMRQGRTTRDSKELRCATKDPRRWKRRAAPVLKLLYQPC
ncbi:hypothetical protein CBR_g4703 [Chara braunii]|uniref:Uncharacterized protein n=1 Tax=Chara braunii TaxID=69332 RepID=A0A388KIL9_CHABU|nr:hypothetical protein CBR_g4703 [Chara braunii]|eukprot:GBG69876.1 hypothetical protein CBR_g4703 [Chara braunii]